MRFRSERAGRAEENRVHGGEALMLENTASPEFPRAGSMGLKARPSYLEPHCPTHSNSHMWLSST